MRIRERAITGVAATISIGGALLLWQFFTQRSESYFFPTPSTVFPHLWADTGGFGEPAYLSSSASDLFLGDGFFEDVVPSMWRMLRGYMLAVFLGITIGTALGLSEVARQYTSWIINFVRAIPPPALLGIWLVVFGIGDGPKVYLIAFAVIWPVLLNTIDGVAAVDEQRKQVGALFKVPFHRQITGIFLPSAAPKIFGGMRICVGFALIMTIISEFAGATNGLGLRLQADLFFFDYPDLWATMIILAVVGLILNGILMWVEGRLLHWHHGMARLAEA